MKLPSKEQIAAFREGCYSHKKPEGKKQNNNDKKKSAYPFREFRICCCCY